MQRSRIEVNNGSLVDGHKDKLDGNDYGIITYQAPLREYFGAALFLVDEDGSSNMAVDASISGTPEVVYLDEPTTGWTNSALTGVWDFASAAITPQSGTESIDATATVDGSQALMERSTTIDLSAFSSISGFIYLTTWNSSRHDVTVEVRLAGVIVGNPVNVNDYVDTGTLGAWLPFVIPKIDMGLNGSIIDQVVFTTLSSSGQPPNYYLDTINIEESGSKVFSFSPEPGQVFELDTINISFSDNITVVEPNQLMGLPSLTNGVRFRTVTDGVTRFGGGIRTIGELSSTGTINSQITGAADTTITLTVPSPGTLIRFNGDTGDAFSAVISDDFSSLTGFTTYIRGRVLK